jgi:peptidoglycan/xylan/chitin deacetylase (PgdA/CDA1 family)
VNPYLAELNFLSRNAYPSFVCHPFPKEIRGYIPVFISHAVGREEFEEKLLYLKSNAYTTCSLDEMTDFIQEKSKLSSPAICLTFDDVPRSMYETAFPLLKKYGFRATAFIVPSFVGTPGFPTWNEIAEMSRSGVVDIQSHTLEHKKIFVSDRPIGLSCPGSFTNALGLDKPTLLLDGRETKDIPDGTVLYEMDSRMSGRPRYLGNGKWETREEMEKAIFRDLAESKKILEEKLNKKIEHLCYPWGIGSRLSEELSRKAGYRTNFFGSVCGRPYNKVGCGMYGLVRLKDDYILRLPGKGRSSLLDVFLYKIRRRKGAASSGRDIYS